MFCDHCGKQIPEGTTFCRFCGAALPASIEESTPSTSGDTKLEPLKRSPESPADVKKGPPSAEPPPSRGIIPGISNPQLIWVILAIVGTILLSLWWPSGLSLLSPLVLLAGACSIIAGLAKGTLRRVSGVIAALLAIISLGIILMEAFRSSTTYFGEVTYYGFEIDTYLLILSVIGGLILFWSGIRAVRSPFSGASPPVDTGLGTEKPKKQPVLWIAVGIIAFVIIGFVLVAPLFMDSLLERSIPDTGRLEGERTYPATPRMTTVPTRIPTSSSPVRTPIPTGTGFVTVTSSPSPTGTPQMISSFQYNRGSGPVPLTVQFTDTTQGGPITAYYWKFGDGTTSSEKNPVHSYTTAGTYWPELTVTTVYGNAWSMSGPITATSGIPTQIPTIITTIPPVTASQLPLEAAFVSDSDLGPVPLTVTFTDRSAGSPASWFWDFGDGGTSTARNPSHTYNEVGSFYVTLTVQNAQGSSLISQGPIEVFYRF
jgi:PKD repeat protein